MKILGIDYGEARMGIAASDESEFLAGGVCCVKVKNMRDAVLSASQKAKELNCKKIVVGLPVNMNGSHGPRAEHAEKFASILATKLQESGMDMPIVMMDERMTTMAASRYLNETDTRGQKRKNVIDTLSAQIILQNALDRLKNM